MAWNIAKSSENYILDMSVNRKAISEHAQKSMIFDTSAFISLESINILELVLSVFSIITTNSSSSLIAEFVVIIENTDNTSSKILILSKLINAEVSKIIDF